MKLTGTQLRELVKDGLTGKADLIYVANTLAEHGVDPSDVVIQLETIPGGVELSVELPTYEEETRD